MGYILFRKVKKFPSLFFHQMVPIFLLRRKRSSMTFFSASGARPALIRPWCGPFPPPVPTWEWSVLLKTLKCSRINSELAEQREDVQIYCCVWEQLSHQGNVWESVNTRLISKHRSAASLYRRTRAQMHMRARAHTHTHTHTHTHAPDAHTRTHTCAQQIITNN